VTTTADRLRSRGLRVTSPRRVLLGVLDEARHDHQHLTAAQLAERARVELGALSLQAVYDVLQVLVESGLARRIEPAGHAALYEGRVGDNHHHLACRACGRIVDVDCAVGPAPCLTPSSVDGFAVDEAEVVFWGLCADCQPTEERTHASNAPKERTDR
jgi:Fur family transcriptional regulator, stress-responsive regulator